MGLKYAGSFDQRVKTCLLLYLDNFMRVSALPATYHDQKICKSTVRCCVDILCLTCAMVCAGSGDLDVFRRLRVLHGRQTADVTCGSHMAVHMAIGVLFMGGGQYSFSNSDSAVAALLSAFYPQFPVFPADNRAHLQAFRHLWVLAAERRCLVTKEADSRTECLAEVRLYLKDGSVEDCTTPCLLPNWDRISSIEITGRNYRPRTLDFSKNPEWIQKLQTDNVIELQPRTYGHFSKGGWYLHKLDEQSQHLGSAAFNLSQIATEDDGHIGPAKNVFIHRLFTKTYFKLLMNLYSQDTSDSEEEDLLGPSYVSALTNPSDLEDLYSIKLLISMIENQSDVEFMETSPWSDDVQRLVERLKHSIWKIQQEKTMLQ